jgi:hypothetical protein
MTFGRVGSMGQILPAELVHEVSLASLSGEFAIVMTTEDLVSTLKKLKVFILFP